MMRRTQADSVADVQRELSEELLGEDVVSLRVLVVPAYHATVAVSFTHSP